MGTNSFFYTFLLLLFTFHVQAQCGLYEISLAEKINQSDLIIEGRVISQSAFKSVKRNTIFTQNHIQVFSVFKGQAPNYIDVITIGGTLGEQMERSESLLNLQTEQTGLFFLNRAQENNHTYTVYASAQGFLEYLPETSEITTVFHTYSNKKQNFFNFLKDAFSLTRTLVYDSLTWNNTSYATRSSMINNFSPTQVNAGVNELITINGFGFGASQGDGKVMFKNSNNGGSTEVEAEAPQYISWSDTKIVVAVPQKAGTGKIAVVSGGSRAQSTNSLLVNYAIINTGSAAQIYPVRLVAHDDNKGYIWHINQNFLNDSLAYNNFMVAFKKWRCKTYINWTIGASTTNTNAERDKLNVVSFDENNELPAGVLGLCYSYYNGCTNNKWYLDEQDLLFKNSDKWHFGNPPIALNKLDFQSVALHELGHAHQIAHVINPSDLMHYAIANGVMKRSIEQNNLDAAQWTMDLSTSSDFCDQKKMQLLDSDLCEDEYFGYFNNVVYPNPFNDNLYIDVFLATNSDLEIKLYDISGKLLYQFAESNAAKGSHSFNLNSKERTLSSGLYLLKIQNGNQHIVKKIICY